MYTTIINADELLELLNDPNLLLVDCRYDLLKSNWGREQYESGHIPNAFFADVNDDLSSKITPETGRHPLPDMENFSKLLESWGYNDQKQVVVYDQTSGAFASRLWCLFKMLGHSNVALLSGGYAYWSKYNLPVSTEIPSHQKAADFEAIQLNLKDVVTTSEVEQNLAEKSFQLIDARANDRFHGENETIDKIGGHIPGAINFFFGRFFDPVDFTFHSKDKVSAELAKLEKEVDGQQKVVYCGSGVTSCLLLLAYKYIGLPMPKIYIGSWSEWIRDPNHPIAT